MATVIDPRTVVPQGKDPIRNIIVQEFIDFLTNVPFDPDEPDGIVLFDIIKMGNLEDLSARETPGAAVEEGSETINETIYEITDKKLRIFVNFKIVRAQGIDPYPIINYYFARIAQLFVTTFARERGLELDIAEAGNSIQTNGSSDTEPGGTIYFDVDYRHRRGNWFSG